MNIVSTGLLLSRERLNIGCVGSHTQGVCSGPDGYDETFSDRFARLLERTGMAARVERRLLDFPQVPDEVDRADVVVLHRVVCCYPDYERLLGAAASKSDRLLVFSHPPRNVATTTVLWWDNARRRVKGDSFRTFADPPAAMLGVLSECGLRNTYRWRGFGWHVVGLER